MKDNIDKIIIVNDQQLRETLSEFCEQISQAVVEKIKSEPAIGSHELMTLTQVAEYLQCSKQSIMNWIKRDKDKNPLPCCRVGADPRFYKAEIDSWTRAGDEISE